MLLSTVLTCEKTEMVLVLPVSSLTNINLAELQLNSASCPVAYNSTHVTARISLDGCGTKTVVGSSFSFHLSLIWLSAKMYRYNTAAYAGHPELNYAFKPNLHSKSKTTSRLWQKRLQISPQEQSYHRVDVSFVLNEWQTLVFDGFQTFGRIYSIRDIYLLIKTEIRQNHNFNAFRCIHSQISRASPWATPAAVCSLECAAEHRARP